MRETCARVLAAALMTGAIATVVAMSALSGATGEAGRPFAAPPSSLKRSVPVVAQATAPRSATARPARSVSPRPQPVLAARSLVVRHWRPRPQRQFAAAKPKARPKPAPAHPPATAPSPAPTPELAPPTVQAAQIVEPPQAPAPVEDQGQQATSDDSRGDRDNGRGHAYGHDKHDD